MATYFEWTDGYNSYAGTDIVVTAQLAYLGDEKLRKKCYVLGSLQTISISTHQDKRPVRAIGNINALDYVMGQRTIAGSLVFAVFDRHFADEIFDDLKSYTNGAVLLTDEIPPLDLTISFANEYGKKSKMALYGVRMVNEGQVMSINDLYTENTYQFVALGMEPLKAEESNYTTISNTVNFNNSNKDDKFSNNDIENDIYIPGNINTGSDDLKDIIINNNYNTTPTNKDLYYIVNQPITENGKGLITFNLDNNLGTNIFIVNQETGEQQIFTPDINQWYIELEQGTYNIKYKNSDKNEESKWYEVVIESETEEEEKYDYAIVNYVTDTNIYFESNNSNHDTLVLIDTTSEKSTKNSQNQYRINKNKAVVSNLKSNCSYEFYTTNGITKSKSTIIKTFEKQDQDLELFINYIKYNKNLLINDLDNFDFRLLNNGGLTIIDKVLNLKDCEIKSELLLFAIKFQNELIAVFNKQSNDNKLSNNSLLNLNLTTDNEIKKVNIYDVVNNNEYFKSVTSNLNTDFFVGAPNKRYLFQTINNKNIKSPKYNFIFLSKDDKEKLNKYNNTNNLTKIDINKYKSKYQSYDSETLRAIMAKEYNIPNYYLIEAPIFNYEDNILYIDVNYKEVLKDDNYYVCIASIYDVLDYTPIRKMQFNNTMTDLYINDYTSSILKNNYYLLWIENSKFEKISTSNILSTYDKTDDLDNYNAIYVKQYLDLRFKILENIFSCKELLSSVYLAVQSYNPYSKNISYILEQEFINQGYCSIYSQNLDNILYKTIQLNNNDTKDLCEKVLIKDNVLNFIGVSNCKMITIDYYLNNELPIKSSYDTFEYNMENKQSLYTVIYLINNSMFNRSGFILINNETEKIYNYDIKLEVL